MRFKISAACTVACLYVGPLACGSGVALAHHSYASFDMNKSESLHGRVSQWEWTNPHSFLHVSVTTPEGGTAEWTFESSSPALLTRNGFTRNTFHVGDELTIDYHPLRNAGNGGSLVTATFSDGRGMSVLHHEADDNAAKP